MAHTKTITITETNFVKNNNPAFTASYDLVERIIDRELDPKGRIVREKVIQEKIGKNFIVIEKEPWLLRYVITASIHGHFRSMPHESASYSRGY
jgi:hypothetical protein